MPDDSGQVPLTRDGGFKMMTHFLDEFEKDVVGKIHRRIDLNDKKTDKLTRAFERATGAMWTLGVVLAIPELVWILMQIFGKGK